MPCSARVLAALTGVVVGLAMPTAVACGDEYDDDGNGAPSVTRPALPTAVTTAGAGATATLDGTNLVVVRTLPAAALSAERLEPAGSTLSPDNRIIEFATVRVGSEVAQWEYVSPDDAGWAVWQPVAVQRVLADVGAGASVASVEAVDWPDACLGAPDPGEACATVITPGFLVIIDVGGRSVRYHTSRTGEFRVAPAVP